MGLSFVVLLSLPAFSYAGSAHFVSCRVSVEGTEVCVEGKEAGLGNLDQINLSLSVVAHCQNRGGNDPEAQNKTTFGTTATAPVQNGKANYDICLTTSFTPSCDPPMTVQVDSVTLVDTTNTIACVLD
jgi:hypothetical protein